MTRTAIRSRSCSSRPARARCDGRRRIGCSSASTTPRSWSPTPRPAWRCTATGSGFKVVGESENYGPEQEHLNNVVGAHLRITTLRAVRPGIEFLQYLAPADGRLAPADTRANDFWHEQVGLVTGDIAAAADALRAAQSTLMSSGIAAIPDEAAGTRRNFMIRRPRRPCPAADGA